MQSQPRDKPRSCKRPCPNYYYEYNDDYSDDHSEGGGETEETIGFEKAIPAKISSARVSLAKRDKTTWDDAGSVVVKLVVGTQRKEFSIHKNFVCEVSEAMKAAFCGNSEESKASVMILDGEYPSTIRNFIAYCHPDYNPNNLNTRSIWELVNL
ncbi:hypothetical protein BKA64DRAFT_23765 [Cadophora sp. MPI-SDFR-AT-0126]|nr:hypothetical protein BKA64DRAFT_23765 [Leotiomycetes sp. MPI-SDFR-AT-0126]